MSEPSPTRRPSLTLRAAAGAWHVPAGFGFILRRPGLWPLAALPAALAVLLLLLGLVLGVFLGPRVDARFAPAPGSVPVWVELPVSLLLWTATLGSCVFLGLGIALALASPVLEQLSRQVEARARGRALDAGKGLRWEAAQALRGSLYFLAAAPGVFLLGLVPIAGPLLSLAWGGRAIAFQMTDPALTRRGLGFSDKRRWHRAWRGESVGFGLAGMVGLLVPFANLVLGPALVAGGTLLVLDLEDVDAERPRAGEPAPGREVGPAA
jgi:CysZ protein